MPENLPKIDFDYYKRQLQNPALIEKLEKGVIYSIFLLILITTTTTKSNNSIYSKST